MGDIGPERRRIEVSAPPLNPSCPPPLGRRPGPYRCRLR